MTIGVRENIGARDKKALYNYKIIHNLIEKAFSHVGYKKKVKNQNRQTYQNGIFLSTELSLTGRYAEVWETGGEERATVDWCGFEVI